MKFTYRQVDIQSGEVVEVELSDNAALPSHPKTAIVMEALAHEGKFEPVAFLLGPTHEGDPRPVCIIFDDESPPEG